MHLHSGVHSSTAHRRLGSIAPLRCVIQGTCGNFLATVWLARSCSAVVPFVEIKWQKLSGSRSLDQYFHALCAPAVPQAQKSNTTNGSCSLLVRWIAGASRRIPTPAPHEEQTPWEGVGKFSVIVEKIYIINSTSYSFKIGHLPVANCNREGQCWCYCSPHAPLLLVKKI